MFKIEIDRPWIDKNLGDLVDKKVPEIVKSKLEFIADGIIHDAFHQLIIEELKKPEYKVRLEELVRELLLDRDAKQHVAALFGRRGGF